jgi:outer membrane protein OmpA-like peptidoglycan-associated protein
VADAGLSGNYGMWMRQIAAQSLAAQVCLQITGHTSASGLAVVNERLSLLRAEYIQSQLNDDEPALKNHTVAAGAGSRENLIGTGRDDATDALDRRVELMPIDRCS